MTELAGQLAFTYDARRARDRALGALEASADNQDRAVIDQAIRMCAATRAPFSANDVRPLLPDVRRSLIGSRFMAAARRGEIRKIGYVTSTDKGTHAHPISEWCG